MLGYTNCKESLRSNVQKMYIKRLSEIDENYKLLYKNVQGTTKFLSETGLYALIFRSKKKNAIKISDWIINQVMPSLRKYGEYKLNEEHKREIDIVNDKFHNIIVDLREQLKQKENENNILKHNMKTRKHPVGNTVYALRTREISLVLDKNEEIDVKIGSTLDMNKRKGTLDTTVNNKTQILKIIKVKDAKTIERCVLFKMRDKLSKLKKDYIHLIMILLNILQNV
jgi:prophage antirepressor-like protein